MDSELTIWLITIQVFLKILIMMISWKENGTLFTSVSQVPNNKQQDMLNSHQLEMSEEFHSQRLLINQLKDLENCIWVLHLLIKDSMVKCHSCKCCLVHKVMFQILKPQKQLLKEHSLHLNWMNQEFKLLNFKMKKLKEKLMKLQLLKNGQINIKDHQNMPFMDGSDIQVLP